MGKISVDEMILGKTNFALDRNYRMNDKDCGVFVIAAATTLAGRTHLSSFWNVE